MVETLQTNIEKLIALYERERQRADALASDLLLEREKNRSQQAKIVELKKEIEDNNLLGAFGGVDTRAARSSINDLIKSIDSCIALLEK